MRKAPSPMPFATGCLALSFAYWLKQFSPRASCQAWDLDKQVEARERRPSDGSSPFEYFASNADPMLEAALLQTATDEYLNATLKEERDRTRILMQQKIGAASENLQFPRTRNRNWS